MASFCQGQFYPLSKKIPCSGDKTFSMICLGYLRKAVLRKPVFPRFLFVRFLFCFEKSNDLILILL